MNIGVPGMDMERVTKGQAKSPMKIAQITPTFGPSSGSLCVPAGTTLVWEEIMKGSVLVEQNLCFETNILDDIFDIIAEAELMDQLGFILEPTIHNVAVQKDRLHQHLESVQNMIKEYSAIVECLTMAEVRLLISCALIPV